MHVSSVRTECNNRHGMTNVCLPDKFTKENEYLISGGVDYSFMSATRNKSTALHYARQKDNKAVLLEVQQGMTGRGGQLDWLSQYPRTPLHSEPFAFCCALI